MQKILLVGLALMLFGLFLLICLFIAAALPPTPPPADEGTSIPEALSHLSKMGVNIPLLLFLFAFTVAIVAITHIP